MKRIYLDQNKWIDLAAAVRDLKKGARFQDALLVLEAGVLASEISLPLSSAHYVETGNRRDWKSRRDLALTMEGFSQMHTIAPMQGVIPPEIDRALHRLTGRPATPRQSQPFGTGASHAFAEEIPVAQLPKQVVLTLADHWGIAGDSARLQEIRLLTGPTPAEEAAVPEYLPRAPLEVAVRYAKDKEELRRRRQAAGWHKGERARRAARAQALADHQDAINDALMRAQLSTDLIFGAGRQGATRFLRSIPTIWASSELERLRHTASQRSWERQDLLDIAALAVASVYCDVVVTERFWVDMAKRAEFEPLFETIFLTRLEDLPAHIV